MNIKQSTEFVKKMYSSIWRPCDHSQLSNYYSTDVIGYSGEVQINYNDIEQHIKNFKKQCKEIIPDFHRILNAGDQVTVWFTQHPIGLNGEELFELETMVTYEIIDNKIQKVWFAWSVDASEFFNPQTHPKKYSVKEPLDSLKKYGLSKRELDVLYYLIRRFSAKEIARNLNISPRTVESHIDQLKEKLNVTSKNAIIDIEIKHE